MKVLPTAGIDKVSRVAARLPSRRATLGLCRLRCAQIRSQRNGVGPTSCGSNPLQPWNSGGWGLTSGSRFPGRPRPANRSVFAVLEPTAMLKGYPLPTTSHSSWNGYHSMYDLEAMSITAGRTASRMLDRPLLAAIEATQVSPVSPLVFFLPAMLSSDLCTGLKSVNEDERRGWIRWCELGNALFKI